MQHDNINFRSISVVRHYCIIKSHC